MSRRKYLFVWLVIAGIASAVWIIFGIADESQYRSFIKDNEAMLTLSQKFAKQMVDENAPGIMTDTKGRRYIVSFKLFFDYVSKMAPNDGSAFGAPNPFPAILPGGIYYRLSGEAQGPDTPLIWTVYYRRNWANVRFEIHCDGSWWPKVAGQAN